MARSAAEVADGPDAAQAFARALACEQAGRTAEAESIYRGLLERFPDQPAVLHNLALLLRAAGGRLAEALTLQQRAVSVAPQEPTLHNTLGVLLRESGRIAEAESSYRKAIALQPDYAEPHYNLGLLLESSGKADDALTAYREAVSAQPGHAKALTRIGVILSGRGVLDEALLMLDQAVTAAPDFFDAHYYRGCVLSGLKRHDEAVQQLTRAKQMRPSSAEVAMAIANAQRDAGDYERAVKSYWSLMEAQPEQLAVHTELNRLCWLAGREDLFLRSFEHARRRLGDKPDLLYLQAAFLLRREQHVAAEQLLRRAHMLAPQRADVAGLLARALAGQRRFKESYEFFEAAINLEPGTPLHRQELGFALLRAGHAHAAMQLFETSLALFPFDQLLLAGLSTAYQQLGDPRLSELFDPSRYVRLYDLELPEGFEDPVTFNRALAQELDALHVAKVEPIDQTLRGGTQTMGRLFAEASPLIAQTRRAISVAVADYISKLPDQPRHPVGGRRDSHFTYSGSWSCRLASGGFHRNHVHPQGWISSAYYVRLPGQVDNAAQRSGWFKLGQSNLDLGEQDRPACFVKPVVGRLVLFPSYYWHGTVPFTDDRDRLTIAFDVVPARKGDSSGSTESHRARYWNVTSPQ